MLETPLKKEVNCDNQSEANQHTLDTRTTARETTIPQTGLSNSTVQNESYTLERDEIFDEFEPQAFGDESGVKKNGKKHWLWDNWILLSMLSLISFSTTNLLIGNLSALGMGSVNYFCLGSLLFSLCYFTYHKECGKLNSRDAKISKNNKVLTRTWDNRIDWWTIVFCLVSACMQFAIFASVILCFRVSHAAGLNIGIAQCIWALNPFLVAITERLFWGVSLIRSQIFGMLALVTCTILVSLSQLFQADKAEMTEVTVDGQTTIVAAVVCSLVMPLVCALFANFIKYADKMLRLNAFDWNCASLGIMSLAFQIVAIVNFSTDSVEFEFDHWIRGTFGSLMNLSGTIFIIAAFNSDGAPFGPIGALVNMQAILVMLVEAIRTQTLPYSLQFAGLAMGIFGALLLTIPDHLLAIWTFLTCGANEQRHNSDEAAASETKRLVQTEKQ